MGGGALRWGLLGTGRMALRFVAGLREAGLRAESAAARDPARAREFAAATGLPRYHESYQALLEDSAIEAVHISLPNVLHGEWTVRALEAGKHVLCEKPAALDGAECARAVAAARRSRTLFMEGFMYRCHPVFDLAMALVAGGRIGAVRRLESAFCYDMGDRPGENRMHRDRAGGALLDVGCYCLHWSRMMAGAAEPLDVEASSVLGATGIDVTTRASLVFPGGIKADFECALRGPIRKAAVVHGEAGRIEIPEPWHPPAEGAEIRVVIPGEPEEVYRAGDGLGLFAREALRAEEWASRGECPILPWKDSLGQARALEALRRAAGHI